MNTPQNHKAGLKLPLPILEAAALLLVLLTGCDNHGRLQQAPEITRAFEENRTMTEYTYYFFGPENRPYAIVGIDPAYRLHSGFWQVVEPSNERFIKMIYWIWTEHNYEPFGAYIMGPDGEKIGIWYSSIRSAAISTDALEKTISIVPDKPYLRGNP